MRCFAYEKADWSLIPHHMRDAIRRYIEHGIRPGGFLEAVLANDLIGAFSRADMVNKNHIGDFAAFIYNDIPSPAWGSYAAVARWVEQGGLNGKSREDDRPAIEGD